MCQFTAALHYNAGVSPVVHSGLRNSGSFTRGWVCGSWHKAEYRERRVLICSLLSRTLTKKSAKETEKQKRIQKGLQPKYMPSPSLKTSNELINS